MARRVTESQLFRRVGHILVSSFDLDSALGSILDEALAAIDADVALVHLLDRPGQRLDLQAARGVPAEALQELPLTPSDGLAGRLLMDGRPRRGTSTLRRCGSTTASGMRSSALKRTPAIRP